MKRAAYGILVSSMLATAAGLGACSSDDSDTLGDGGTTSPEASVSQDSGTGDTSTGTPPSDLDSSSAADTSSPTNDSSTPDSNAPDSSSIPDAGPDVTPTASFCQTQVGLDFCDDFDRPGPLSFDSGATTEWSSLVGTSAEVALSSARASSAPNSLLVALRDGTSLDDAGNGDQSAKVVKMITPANGVAQAIYEFDMYIDSFPLALPNEIPVGGFATDFQFSDTSAGSDRFGFRIGVFANATGFDHADLEHNHPDIPGGDDITSPIPIVIKAWNHVKMVVAYSALADDGGDSVHFQLYIGPSGTAATLDATYPAPFAKADFARFAAGMVYAFQGDSKDWHIFYDNFTLKLQ